jgi:hypothetical protein
MEKHIYTLYSIDILSNLSCDRTSCNYYFRSISKLSFLLTSDHYFFLEKKRLYGLASRCNWSTLIKIFILYTEYNIFMLAHFQGRQLLGQQNLLMYDSSCNTMHICSLQSKYPPLIVL